MNWDIFFGIAGIVVTVVISLLIFFLQKSRKYPGRLSASLIDLYRVLGQKPEHYADLSLNLGDYQIENNLLYIKLILFNEKSFDIEANTPETQISMVFPNNINWVDLHVVKYVANLNVDVSINTDNKSEASIGFSLLKQGESIILEGLIETEEEYSRESLFNQIQFLHRIPNVGNTAKIFYPLEINEKWRPAKLIITLLFALALFCFALWTINNDTVPLRYIDQVSGKSVSIALNKDSELVVYPKTWTRGDSYIVSENYFKEHFSPETKFNHNYGQTFAIACICFLLFIIIIGDLDYIIEAKSRKRISKFL